MNGNGELTETDNVIFYVSYWVLAEFLRMNVILTYFATATVTATDTERWKSGMSVITHAIWRDDCTCDFRRGWKEDQRRWPSASCSRLRNDLYCVGWGVKLYSLTHSLDRSNGNIIVMSLCDNYLQWCPHITVLTVVYTVLMATSQSDGYGQTSTPHRIRTP